MTPSLTKSSPGFQKLVPEITMFFVFFVVLLLDGGLLIICSHENQETSGDSELADRLLFDLYSAAAHRTSFLQLLEDNPDMPGILFLVSLSEFFAEAPAAQDPVPVINCKIV